MNTGKIFARLRLIRNNTMCGGGVCRIGRDIDLCVEILGKLSGI